MNLDGDAFDLDLAAATLRSNSTDVGIMLRGLIDQLSDVLGKRLVVERSKGLLHKGNEIRSITVSIGDDELRADVEGASLSCTVGHSSGGIRIRSTKVGVDEWLKRLLQGLQAEAATSEQARMALENLVIGGPQ